MRLTVETLAKHINDYCNNSENFWAYGLVKETINLWNEKNIGLLNDTARVMVIQVKEQKEGKLE